MKEKCVEKSRGDGKGREGHENEMKGKGKEGKRRDTREEK